MGRTINLLGVEEDVCCMASPEALPSLPTGTRFRQGNPPLGKGCEAPCGCLPKGSRREVSKGRPMVDFGIYWKEEADMTDAALPRETEIADLFNRIEEEVSQPLPASLPNERASGAPVSEGRPQGKALKVSPAMGRLLGVSVDCSVEIGSARMEMGQILGLRKSVVVLLDRSVDQPVDFKVNGVLFARGTVVESRGHYALRVLEVISGAEKAGTF